MTDVLKLAGFDEDKTTSARHVIFEGLDHGPDMEHFNASIPIEKANDPRGDVILAYQMNGEDISRDHGYPIRDDCIFLQISPTQFETLNNKGFSFGSKFKTVEYQLSF